MAQTSYPFDNLDTTESQYSQLFKRLQLTGVSGNPSSADLRVSANSSGMQVTVAAGFAIVRGHAYQSDTEETLSIAASATNPRRDLVVLRLDPSANSATLAVKTGTPASSPSDPSLTQTEEGVYEMALARVTVPANAVTVSASDVLDRRTFTGTQVGRWQTSLRPASPESGQVGFNTSVNLLEYWDGDEWVSVGKYNDAVTASQISSQEQALFNVGRINGSRISVQQTAPSSPSTGDLWFW
jgi:hypothetical protein